MRVAADPSLKEGDEFKLVIYGQAGRAPLLLKARVLRNEGEAGCALCFHDVEPTISASLDEMVESLPQAGRDEAGVNVVVSEIIENV